MSPNSRINSLAVIVALTLAGAAFATGADKHPGHMYRLSFSDATPRQLFEAKAEKLEVIWRAAEAARAAQSWGEALNGSDQALQMANELETQNAAREKAQIAKQEAASEQESAKAAKADEAAVESWKDANSRKQTADSQFNPSDFDKAAAGYQSAAKRYASAKTRAGQVAAYSKARDAFAASMATVPAELVSKHGGAEWAVVEKNRRLGEASADDPVKEREANESALAALPEASALAEYRSVVEAAKSQKEKAAGMDKSDRAGPGVVKQALAAIAAFSSSASYGRLADAKKAELAAVKRELVALSKKFQPVAGELFTVPDIGMEFVWIEAMSCWVGKYEVTNGEYRKYKPDHDSGILHKSHEMNGDRQPVVLVSYDEAVVFADWLNQTAQLPEGWKARLPDGDEWMKFAQCGDGRKYPWGNDMQPPKDWNYHGQEGAWIWYKIPDHNDGFPVTCEVEKSGMNKWGLYGVGGNVWEWTSEWYDSSQRERVVRGASWLDNHQDHYECACRFNYPPWLRVGGIGFRLVLCR